MYHGITHITPDTSTSVHKISQKVDKLSLHVNTPTRQNITMITHVVDSLTLGEQKLKSSTLAMFNKKIRSMFAGEGFETEVDELPRATFDLSLKPE